MPVRRRVARSVLLAPAIALAALFVLQREPRLISYDRLPEPDGQWCAWDEYVERMNAPLGYAAVQAGQQRRRDDDDEEADTRPPAKCSVGGCDAVAARPPLRYVQDPNPEFSSLAVDALRNEVVLN